MKNIRYKSTVLTRALQGRAFSASSDRAFSQHSIHGGNQIEHNQSLKLIVKEESIKERFISVSTRLDQSTQKEEIKRDLEHMPKPDDIAIAIDRRKVLIACLFSLMATQTLFLNVENILPTWIPDNFHDEITPLEISIILSSFELSSLVFSPLIGKYLDKIGRKNAIIVGDGILIASTMLLGGTQYISHPVVYVGVSFLLRFLQGVGNALVQTACYAIITFVFSDNREKYLGYAEAFTGLGLMLGPVIGGLLYAATNYFWTFFTFGIFMAFSLVITLIITPSILNASIFESSVEGEAEELAKQVTFSMFLLNKRSLFAYLSVAIVCLFMNYQSSFLTEVLRDEKHIPEVFNGCVLALPCLTYTISCICVNYIVGRFPRRILILFSFLLLTISMWLQGPSEILHIPDYLWIVLMGFALNGVAQGFIFIPLLPDAIEAVYIKEQIVEGENEQLDQLISDYGSGLYGTFFSSGQILAPIVGGLLFQYIDYRPTTDLMALVCLFWCVIFFLFNVGFRICSQEKKIKLKMEMLKDIRANSGINGKKKDEDEEEEELEDFLKKQREKWKNIKHSSNKNNLSSIEEAKAETFLESKNQTIIDSNFGNSQFLRNNDLTLTQADAINKTNNQITDSRIDSSDTQQ